MTAASRVAAVVALTVVLIAVAAVRLRVADVPLERDEGEYAYAGQLILQGIPPYQLAYNMKFPGTYYAYSAILALFGQTPWGIHVGLLVVNAATTVLVFLLGWKLLGEFGGVIAAAAFALLSLDRWTMGVFAHATHFVLLPALGGLVILAGSPASRRARDIVVAGALLGTAVLMKQHAAAFALLGAAVVAWDEWQAGARPSTLSTGSGQASSGRARRSVAVMLLLLLGAVIPFAVLCLVLGAQGMLGKFWFWTVLYAKEYVSETPASAIWPLLPLGWQRIMVATVPLWWLAAVGFVTVFLPPHSRRTRLFLLALTVASLAAIVPGFYFRQHYFILLLPAAALLIASAVVSTQRALEGRTSPLISRAAAASVFAAVAASYIVAERDYLWSMPPAELSRQLYAPNPFVEAQAIGRYIGEHTAPEDRIAVIGSEPEIYFYANRKSATGYIYTYALMEPQPFALRMQHEMIDEIESVHPAYVVFVPIHTSWLPLRHDQPILQWAVRYIEQCYERVTVAAAGEAEDNPVTTHRRRSTAACSAK